MFKIDINIKYIAWMFKQTLIKFYTIPLLSLTHSIFNVESVKNTKNWKVTNSNLNSNLIFMFF